MSDVFSVVQTLHLLILRNAVSSAAMFVNLIKGLGGKSKSSSTRCSMQDSRPWELNTCKQNVLRVCDSRHDEVSEIVKLRMLGVVSDPHASSNGRGTMHAVENISQATLNISRSFDGNMISNVITNTPTSLQTARYIEYSTAQP